MKIKILGTGCSNCQKLEANTKEAAENLKMEVAVERVRDIEKIMGYGVMGTPALVIDEEVKSYGRVLNTGEIEELLMKHKNNYVSSDNGCGCCCG